MKVDIKVEGLQHLQDLLTTQLPAKAQTKVMVRALKKAGRPMVTTVRGAYRGLSGSGALAQATTMWQRKKGTLGRNTFASVEIGPKRGNKSALAKYYSHYRKRATPKSLIAGIRHGHLVEFGFTHRGGKAVAGKNILGAAMDKHGRSAITEFGAILGAEIEREALRVARLQQKGQP